MFIKNNQYTIISNVRAVRIAAKLTQDELASAVHTTRQTIIAIEKGNYVPSVLLALHLARVLQKPVEELFYYEKI